MKINFLKSLLTIACLLCCIGVYAQDFEVDGIYYNIISSTDKTVAVTYRGRFDLDYENEYIGTVVIPESVTYNGANYKVTSIGESAFHSCFRLTEVTIPNSVTSIDAHAFYNCYGLTEVTIPNSVTSIGYYAFHGCTGLTEVTIGNSVTSIGNYAFETCSRLTEVTIPNSVTSIGRSAFEDCIGLKEVTIGNSVTEIGESAFHVCTRLIIVNCLATTPPAIHSNTFDSYSATLYVPVESMDAYRTANYWKNFSIIRIPDCFVDGLYYNILSTNTVEVTYKDKNYNSYLGTINIPETVEIEGATYSVTSIGSDAFYECTGLTEVTIPNSVTSIGDFAFSRCTGLKEVTIGNSVTLIGVCAFEDCTGLTEIHCHATTPPTISVETFSDYSASLYVPVESMDAYRTANYWEYFNINKYFVDGLYYNILSTTDVEVTDNDSDNNSYSGEINIPETIEIEGITYNVTSIDHGAFFECGELTSITIPNRITSIGDNVFFGCTGLTEVVIPTSVTSLGQAAFCNCTGLTKITIPNSLTSIPNHAFYGCTSLSEIAIPNSVISIGYYTFSGCTGLTEVTIGNSVTSIGDWAFSDCTGLTEVTIGSSVTSIGYEAFYGCTGLRTVTIGSGVNEIGENTFAACDRIKTVNCYAQVPPTIYSNTFTVYVNDNATLHVVQGCKDAYADAKYWEYFMNITDDLISADFIVSKSIVLDQTNITAIAGETVVLTATIYPEDATKKGVVWSVSDATIATIEPLDSLSAKITVLREGTATITATTIDGSNLTATCVIDIYSGIDSVEADAQDAEYYTIDGMKLAKKPARGIYIMKQGNTVKKVVL